MWIFHGTCWLMQVVQPVLPVKPVWLNGCLMMFVGLLCHICHHVIMFSSPCCWLDVCIYVCYSHVFFMVWFGDSFGWMLDVSYMPGLPLPEGDHCRLLVPGFDMANHDPRSRNDSPPHNVSPLNVDVSVVDRLAGTGRTHTILEAYNFLKKSSKHLELNQKSWNSLQWLPQDGHVALIASVDYDKGDEVDIGTFFLLVGKLKENCVEKVCCFFQTPCVFELRVIPQMLILSMKVSISELSLTGMHLLRES